jgi:hypothetical protein
MERLPERVQQMIAPSVQALAELSTRIAVGYIRFVKQMWQRCVNGKASGSTVHIGRRWGIAQLILVVSCYLLVAKNGQSVSCMMLENRTDPIAFARDMKRLRRPLRLRGRWRPPKDGLYRVATSKKVHGGFLVQRRRVTRASPYVRRYIHVLALKAEWFGDPFACE